MSSLFVKLLMKLWVASVITMIVLHISQTFFTQKVEFLHSNLQSIRDSGSKTIYLFSIKGDDERRPGKSIYLVMTC